MRDDFYIDDMDVSYRTGYEIGIDDVESSDFIDIDNINHNRFLEDEMVEEFKRGYEDGVRDGIDKVYGDIEESADE